MSQTSQTAAHPAFKMFVGAAAAAAILYGLSSWLITQPTFDPVDVSALGVSALLLFAGVFTLLPTLDGKALARALDPDAGDRASLNRRELGLIRLQGALVALSGIVLAAPMMLADSGLPSEIAYGVFGAIFLLHLGLNVAVWRASDSFNRRVIMEAGALSFLGVQAALVLWAGAERMGLAPAITTWTAAVVLMGVYFLATVWMGMRRIAP